jgi:hypothetical protein
MASYTELYALNGTVAAEPLRQKVLVALCVKANALAKASPTAAQKAFAVGALRDPASYLSQVFNYILADYGALTTAAITGATDAQVQTAVNAAVDTLLGA